MTLHNEIEQSDDDEGAYRTDKPITFDHLCKSTTSTSSVQSQPTDWSADDSSPPDSEATESAADSRMATSRPPSSRSKRSTQRKRLADAVAHRHVESGADQTLASTGVDGVAGKYTTFHFCMVEIDGTPCYYLLQRSLTGTRVAGVTTAVKAVGTNWEYRIPTIDGETLNEAIQKVRHRDLRDGDDPVEFLSDEQVDAIQREYTRLVELKMAGIEDASDDCSPVSYLFEQFLVFDVSEVVFRARVGKYLSDRQLDIVVDRLLAAVWTDLGGQRCNNVGVTDAPMECPVVVELIFDF